MKKYLIILLALFSLAALVVNGCTCKKTQNPVQSGSTATPTTPTGPVACSPAKTPVPGTWLLIDNCDQGSNSDALGGYWFTICDCAAGTPPAPNGAGNSTVWPVAGSMGGGPFMMSYPGAGGCGYAARITGTVNGAAQGGYTYGFIGMACQTSSLAGSICQGMDWSPYTGIQFYAKTGPTDSQEGYSVIIPNTGDGVASLSNAVSGNICTDAAAASSCASTTAYNDPWVSNIFPPNSTWTQYTIPFTDFGTQGAWGNYIALLGPSTDVPKHGIYDVKQLQWQTIGRTYPFNVDLWVDEIILYK